MSIVHGDLPGARVLDLFAGSGALGLEALSRGAALADFVESVAPSLRTLRANIELLGTGDIAVVRRADALRFAAALDSGAYDVAFADPPYRAGLATRIAEIWIASPFARVLGVEHDASEELPGAHDVRRYGDTAVSFYRSAAEGERGFPLMRE